MLDEAPGSLFVAGLDHDALRGRQVGRLRLRVRYAESDRMGIVYNAHYLTWFEIGRTELMRSAGTPYSTVEEMGYLLPLVEATLRLRTAVRYDDVIEVETWIDELRSRVVVFAYRISHAGTLIAEGSTRHACVRSADNHAAAFPDWLRETIQRMIDS